ncbi:MAG: hypothetical protein LBI01_06735 [Elusimicrobium sp.]|jgi:hypothetical protein|nr:hypothetical protein [Elusimicrobium sp.]
MKKLRAYILLFAAVAALGGCGLDIGQIYILINKAGGWRQTLEKVREAEHKSPYMEAVAANASAAGQQTSSSSSALTYLDDRQKKLIEIIKAVYGDAAAGEAQAEYAAMNEELKAAAVSAKNDKDFLLKQQQIIAKRSANIKAITLKYRQ